MKNLLTALPPWLSAIAVWVVHWWAVLAGGEHFFRRDLALFALPSKQFWIERARDGALPEWTPLLSGGMPFASDPANQTFYPLNLLLLLGSSVWSSLTLFILAHSALALAGFYFLARTLHATAWLAVWGALIYALSGYALSITDNLNYLPATAWLPIALAFYWRAINKSMRIYAPLAGLTIGCIILAGDVVSASCLFGLMLILAAAQRAIPVVTHLKCILVALLIATLVACVQIVPAYSLIAMLFRDAAVLGASAMTWSFPPIRGFELIQPAIVGSVQFFELFHSAKLYPKQDFPWAESVYVGLIPALVAISFIKSRQIQLWLLLLAIALALSLGRHLPVVPEIWATLIGLGTQRFPEKLLLFVTLFLCIAATVASRKHLHADVLWWDRLPLLYRIGAAVTVTVVGFLLLLDLPVRGALGEHRTELSTFWTLKFGTKLTHLQGLLAHSAILIIPVLLWLMLKSARSVLGPLILVVAVGDLLWMHKNHPITIAEPIVSDAAKAWAKLPTAETLETARVYVDADVANIAPRALPAGVSVLTYQEPFVAELITNMERLTPMIGVLAGLQYWNGHWSPLQSRLHAITDGIGMEVDAHQYLSGASIDFVVTTLVPANSRWQQEGFTEVHRDQVQNLRIFKVLQSKPRAYIALNAQATDMSLPSHERVKRALLRDCDCVFLDHGPSFSAPSAPTAEPPSLTVTSTAPEYLSAKVSVPSRSAVVFNESHAPGWTATIDGIATELYVANHRAMAVVVEPGAHKIALTYVTPWLAQGATLSALGIALGLGISGRGLQLARRRKLTANT